MLSKKMVVVKNIMAKAVCDKVTWNTFGDAALMAKKVLMGEANAVAESPEQDQALEQWQEALQDKGSSEHDAAVEAFVLALLEGSAQACVQIDEYMTLEGRLKEAHGYRLVDEVTK